MNAAKKLRDMTLEELQQQGVDWRSELVNLRIRKSASQIEQPSRIRILRRSIARVETVLRERARKEIVA
jgi:large subunit ribosomal protein L29